MELFTVPFHFLAQRPLPALHAPALRLLAFPRDLVLRTSCKYVNERRQKLYKVWADYLQ